MSSFLLSKSDESILWQQVPCHGLLKVVCPCVCAGRVSSSVANQVRTHSSREAAARSRIAVDKSNRATVEQVSPLGWLGGLTPFLQGTHSNSLITQLVISNDASLIVS